MPDVGSGMGPMLAASLALVMAALLGISVIGTESAGTAHHPIRALQTAKGPG